MQSFNLFDRSLLPPPPDWLMLGTLTLAAAGLVGLAAHGVYEKQALAALMAAPGEPADAAAQDGGDAELRELTERVARRNALRQSYRQSGGSLEQAGALLERITAALPDDMWLAEVELGADRSLRVAGLALQAPSLHGFTARLQQAAGVRGVPLTQFSVERIEPESATDPMPPRLKFVIQGGNAAAEAAP